MARRTVTGTVLPWAVDASVVLYIACLVLFPSSSGVATPWFTISPARAALGLAFLAALLDAALARDAGRIVPPRPIVLAWGLFLASAAGSTLLSPTAGGTVRFGALVVEGAGAFWLVWRVARRRPRYVHMSIVTSSGVVALITVAMSVVGLQYGGLFSGEASTDIRFGIIRQTASFDAPLFFAVWMVALGSLALGAALSDSAWIRRIGIAVWAVSVAAIATTASRFAITAVPTVMAIMLLGFGRVRAATASAVIAVIVGFIVFSGSFAGLDQDSTSPTDTPGPSLGVAETDGTPPPAGTSPTIPATQPDSDTEKLRSSNAARFEALRVAVAAVGERPLFGWGPLSAKEVGLANLGHINYIDNGYLVILIEFGLLGLGSFLVLLASIGFVILPQLRGQTATLLFSQTVAITSLLAFSVVAAFWATSQGYATFWTLVALAVGTAEAIGPMSTNEPLTGPSA